MREPRSTRKTNLCGDEFFYTVKDAETKSRIFTYQDRWHYCDAVI